MNSSENIHHIWINARIFTIAVTKPSLEWSMPSLILLVINQNWIPYIFLFSARVATLWLDLESIVQAEFKESIFFRSWFCLMIILKDLSQACISQKKLLFQFYLIPCHQTLFIIICLGTLYHSPINGRKQHCSFREQRGSKLTLIGFKTWPSPLDSIQFYFLDSNYSRTI